MPRKSKKSNLVAARQRMYHDLIFECAERVFAEEGFQESSMQDLAAEAGVSLKTLYATFPGKDEIYREILEVRGAGLLEGIASATEGDGSAFERLAAAMRAVIGYLVEHDQFFRILLQEGQAWGLNPRGEGAREAWQAGIGATRRVIADGIASGEFLPGDPDLLAPTVNALLQVQLAGCLERKGEADPEAIADEILTSLHRLLCGTDAEGATRAA